MVKVKLYGAKEQWCQVPRIKQGLMGLGHSVVAGDDHDFIYANNFDYGAKDSEHGDSALYHKDSSVPKDGFKIFNVLDIPPHIPDFPIEKLKDQLRQANIVTCISEPVKEQLANIGVEARVIWNPIKDVFHDPSYRRGIPCLYVGRANDPNKRVSLLSEISGLIHSIGPSAGVGRYLGLVDDVALNHYYNSSKIVALPTKFEGLGLTVLEAMVCGAIPLVCSDNPNSKLCPEFCICEPTIESVTKKYKELLDNFSKYQKIILSQYSSQTQKKFSKFTIAENIIRLYNQK
tara:strand:+ start:2510 stop:3376 length:867 start_codon:yes stop_codon:yes gene_type:complete